MKRANPRRAGKGGLELLEEAVHSLRVAPLATLAVYYLGAIPFVLGLLYFWADMSRSAVADRHLAEAALAMAILFGWMKFCQTLFVHRMRSQIAHEPAPQWGFGTAWRVFKTQALVHCSGLFLLPMATILVLPFVWVYPFYQNVTALGEDRSGRVWPMLKEAWKQTLLWPAQNYVALGTMLAFSVYVYLNWLMVCLSVPHLLKSLLGIESVFTRADLIVMLLTTVANSTFQATIFALTYLCVDPILKTVYVLRVFYGQSLQSGEDLKSELKRITLLSRHVPAGLVILFQLAGGVAANGAEQDPGTSTSDQPASTQGVSSSELDRAINDVIQERKYTWRMPREKAPELDEESEQGMIAKFFTKAGEMIQNAIETIVRWIRKILEKLFGDRHTRMPGGSGSGWILMLRVLLYALVVAAIVAVALLLYRTWRRRRAKRETVAAEALESAPDLADESVGPDQLPEDGWTRLGRELLERGELRLAMRAFYLASLAHLAERNLISIARFKSNRDYERELLRRGHSFPDLLSTFGENVSVFERIWYGLHEVNRELVAHFAANVERIRAA